MKQYSKLDSLILKHYKLMIDRCYNSKSISFKNYGARGVTVCDQWKNNKNQFILDFKNLPGYNEWLNTSDTEKYLFNLDKDLRGSYTDENGIYHESLVYSPESCSIIHIQLNARIKYYKNKRSQYRGVLRSYKGKRRDPNGDSYIVSFEHDHIAYRAGSFSSELAAASVYNYYAKNLPNFIINNLSEQEMRIEEAMKYLTSRKLILPSSINYPDCILNCGAKIIYDGSEYYGVKKNHHKQAYRAFGMNDNEEVFLGEYKTELAAATIVRNYYLEKGMSDPNNLAKEQIILNPEEFRSLTSLERKNNYNAKIVNNLFTQKIIVGSIYTDPKGDKYEILKIINPPTSSFDVSRGFQVLLKSLQTGAVFTAFSRNILRNKSFDKNDYLLPSVYGVGYRGIQFIPQDDFTQKVYRMWHDMFARQSIINSDINFIKSTICDKWYNFMNFLEDIVEIKGYNEFKLNYQNEIYSIENISLQPNKNKTERIWNLSVCTIIPFNQLSSLISKTNRINTKQHDNLTIGIYNTVSNKYKAEISLAAYTGDRTSKLNVGTFDNIEMAAAARDYYNRFYNHKASNCNMSDSIPVQEWQAHKSRMKPLYHLVQRQLYTLTNEDENERRERCLRKYGIEM